MRTLMVLTLALLCFAGVVLSQARETYADLPGVRLWYRDSGGNGVPVVLLHANTGSSLNWQQYQFPAFSAAGFRVIAYDRRGWGKSTPAAGAAPATGADDLQALMKSLGIQRFHLLGTAGGGFVAFDYALSFPEQLRSLIVVNSVGGMQDEDYLELHRRLRPPQFEAMPPDLRELGPAYRAADPEGVRRWLEFEHQSRQPNAAAQPFRNRMTFAMLESIKLPTLLMTSEADMFAPPPLLRMFTARIKGAQSMIIPEAGHSSYWEKPDVFNKAVLDFLRKH